MANSHHKPTIVLIPGAWHSPSHYHELILRLHKAGYATQCLRLPSVNPDPGTAEQADVANDIAFTREKILLPLVDEAGEDVVVVMHSYGGIPGSGAARGLSKVERRSRGLQGGVVGLVFIAAFPAKEGQSLVSLAAPLDGEQSPATAFEIDVRPMHTTCHDRLRSFVFSYCSLLKGLVVISHLVKKHHQSMYHPT